MYIVQKHRIHLKFGCDERFSNYIYKSIIKGKKLTFIKKSTRKQKKISIFKKTINNL